MLQESIKKLVEYGIRSGLSPECERIYATNLILDLFHEDEYTDPSCDTENLDLEEILKDLLDCAVERGIIEDSIVYRDLFDTKIMNCLCPRPAEVQRRFREEYAKSPEAATAYFYDLSQKSNYIRTARVKKDLRWKTATPYGDIDITINLSKPEKDPKAIAAALKAKNSAYPKCQLCMENEGYAGRVDHPARENHRIIPVTINNEKFGFQYSPYVYFNEHCIVFNSKHVPMKIDRAAFQKLFDFVEQFPHYLLGSNADLPIVGGSILTHDHFQGGHYTFAMQKAPVVKEFTVPGFSDVQSGIIKWPLSVIRLSGTDKKRVIDLADHILTAWRGYSDPDAVIYAETDGVRHNTITPIARMHDGHYVMDLALRNNLTTPERPLGLYHPRPAYHHIKKENIGLIEVMGLAVLPSRLKKEMEALRPLLVNGDIKGIRDNAAIASHADWAEEILGRRTVTEDNATEVLKEEIGQVFCHVLEDAGVYKWDDAGHEAFMRFIGTL